MGDKLHEWCTRPALSGRHGKTIHAIHLLVLWELWKHRNFIVFEGMTPATQHVLRRVASECLAWEHVGILRGDLEAFSAVMGVWADGE